MATSTRLQRFIDKYGPTAGPKLYHALQSRAAYIGANSRRRRTIAELTSSPTAEKRFGSHTGPNLTPLLIDAEVGSTGADLAASLVAC